MITEFKSKEQLAIENSQKVEEELKKYYSEKELGRFKRILKNEAQGDDRLFLSNSIVNMKFKLRDSYKKLDRHYKLRNTINNRLKLDSTEKSRIEHEEYLANVNDGISELKEGLLNYGALLSSYIPLLDKYFSEQEIIQLLSGSYEEAKNIKEYYDKDETGTRSLTDSFIIHHIEYRWRKGRSKDFIDCPDYEMPLFNCISKYMWKAINNNPTAKADMDNFFEDTLGGAMVYTIRDGEGNVISAEKVFQDVTQNELIRDYQGAFINELKQKNILDNETTYKIKRIDNGVYSIIGENKESIATIYKKIS